MGVLNSSRKVMKDFIEKSYSMGQLHGEMKKINDPRRQKLIETVHLTKAEENKIDTLFTANYGKKIKYDWHKCVKCPPDDPTKHTFIFVLLLISHAGKYHAYKLYPSRHPNAYHSGLQ